jgi:putative peptidoglycan lipid II flippase
VPALKKKGFRYYPSLNVRSEGMRKVFALMLPVMVSAWVQPINLTINSRFGSHLYNGAGVSAIEIATNLYLIIAGVFVLSITNVIFPKLSRLTAGNEEDAFQETLKTTMHGCLFFVMPMAAGLMVVSKPLVQLIYGDGQFDAFAVEITAQALFWVSLGMVGYAMQNVLSRAYFAKQNGKGPLITGAISIGVNLVLCVVLTDTFQIAGLAMASAASSTVYALLLDLPLERKGQGFLSGAFLIQLVKMVLATVAMSAVSWGVLNLTGGFVAGKLGHLISMGAAAGVGVLVYFVMALILGLKEAVLVFDMAKRVLKRG